MKSKYLFLPLLLLFTVCSVISCSNHKRQETLNRAQSIMETNPDSALKILSGIDKTGLESKAERARYALLLSIALDKNYIDTTTFDVLQPAIDYYLIKGTPDDKLRTYYYQGRIFDNKGERDSALNSFVKAIDNFPESTDSLCAARAYVSLARMFYEFHDIDSYMLNYLRAAKIYNKNGNSYYEFDCLLNALNGAIVLNRKNISDSLINVCNSFDSLSEMQHRELQKRILTHKSIYGTKAEVEELIKTREKDLSHDVRSLLNLAAAHQRIGNNKKALQIIEYINNSGVKYDTLKLLAVSVSAYRDLGDYKNALLNYWNFSHRTEAINALKFEQKSKSIEEKHKIEIKAQNEARKNSKIIWMCIGGIIFLILGIFILLLLVRTHKMQKNLAVQKAKTTQLENENLKSEKEKLALENENLLLERDKKTLEAENLAHRVEILENESESLKKLLDNPEEIPAEVRDAIKVRIEMLNSLLASYITANDQYGKPYDIWVKELTENTREFMNSNRLAFQVSHPNFIQYFEEHGLTIDEINYVCLYALGLRGKEVGNYMKKRSHVNTSSAIRKKLGIDKHETNIGIYVRNLLKNL